MAELWGTPPEAECCCGAGCGGCCWAADPEDPSQAIPITFDIVAVGCNELDSGTQGSYVFTPQESLTGVPQGACGPCTWMLWSPDTGKGTVGGYETLGSDLPSPCGWQIAAALVCLAPDAGQAPTDTTEPCCANVRLLMSADNEFTGSRPLTDFTTLQEFAPYADAAQSLIDLTLNQTWGKLVEPSSCSCDEVTGMHAEFSIAGWVSPACSGDPPFVYECCEPTICDLSGGVLQF